MESKVKLILITTVSTQDHPGFEKLKASLDLFNWEYVVIPSENGGYGYTILIYKNGVEIYKQGGFGSTGMAQVHARDIFLSDEFGIDRGEENQ